MVFMEWIGQIWVFRTYEAIESQHDRIGYYETHQTMLGDSGLATKLMQHDELDDSIPWTVVSQVWLSCG